MFGIPWNNVRNGLPLVVYYDILNGNIQEDSTHEQFENFITKESFKKYRKI